MHQLYVFCEFVSNSSIYTEDVYTEVRNYRKSNEYVVMLYAAADAT